MLLMVVLPFFLIIPGLTIIQFLKIKFQATIEKLVCSYIISLSVIFFILYLGGIFHQFSAALIIVIGFCIGASLYLFFDFILANKDYCSVFREILNNISREEIVFIILTTCLVIIYSIFLSSRALLDSDVVQYYLPISRDILIQNGFTHSTGYDFNVFLRPIAGSVLYSLAYFTSGSLIIESFRLMPLIPILILILLVYKITFYVTTSKTIGLISATFFLLLPFNGRFILYNAFYPDVFFYPLIFAALYFLLKYLNDNDTSQLIWIGISLGIASLIKAQTIFSLVVIMCIILISDVRRSKAALAISFLLPFVMIIPNLLLEIIQREGLILVTPIINEFQMLLFSFLALLAVLGYIISSKKGFPREKIEKIQLLEIIKKILFLIIPVVIFSSLWYLYNIIQFGSLLFTSSINLPNYNWALEILSSIAPTSTPANPWYYFGHFAFMFVHPAVMGYISLVLVVAGLFFLRKLKSRVFSGLVLYGLFFGIAVFSDVAWSLQYNSAITINPRDILVLAPILTTLAACGIQLLINKTCRYIRDYRQFFLILGILGVFGILNYIHNVEVWFVKGLGGCLICVFSIGLSSFTGLSISQTTMQLYAVDQISFPTDYFLNIGLVVIFGLLVLLFYMLALDIIKRSQIYTSTLQLKIQHFRRRIPQLKGLGRIKIPRNLWAVTLVASVILVPRLEMLMVQGGIQGIAQNQLQRTYGPIYDLFASDSDLLQGHILTYRAPYGLAYYLPGFKVVDLKSAANLAYLKDDLVSNTSADTVNKLVNRGIRHLLINPGSFNDLDAALNNTLSDIISNSTLATLMSDYGSWELHILWPS